VLLRRAALEPAVIRALPDEVARTLLAVFQQGVLIGTLQTSEPRSPLSDAMWNIGRVCLFAKRTARRP
jgi:hypothetical protein